MVEVKDSGSRHVLNHGWGKGQGHAPSKILQQSLFVCQLNYMESRHEGGGNCGRKKGFAE